MTTDNHRGPLEHLAIAGVRVLVALMWLANIHWKVPPAFGEDTGGGLFKYAESVTRHSTFAPYTWVTEQFILPNFKLFGWFTLIAEIVIALLLLVGYRTRLTALAGAAFTVPIFFSVIYYDRADEWSWAYFMMFGIHIILWAAAAGHSFGLDGVLRQGAASARSALLGLGLVAGIVGVLGLFVSRSVAFAGKSMALLGSDAGFVVDGAITRRWELKLLWFNPLLAILTIVFGVLLFVGARMKIAALVAAAGFAVLTVVSLIVGNYSYLRDDGVIQNVASGSNTAFWGALALAGFLLARRTDLTPAAGTIDS